MGRTEGKVAKNVKFGSEAKEALMGIKIIKFIVFIYLCFYLFIYLFIYLFLYLFMYLIIELLGY